MTDAHQQSLYDLVGAVYHAGRKHAKDKNIVAAPLLLPLLEQIGALVEGMLQEEREAWCKACEDNNYASEVLEAMERRSSPPQPEVPA